jgi:hypothetical protein
LPRAKFSKKADVFAAGIIFLELISLSPPNTLYQVLYPRIVHDSLLPAELKDILSKSLAEAIKARTGSFDELLFQLRSSQEKVVAEMINDAEFTMDAAPGNSVARNVSVWLDLPETDSLALKNSSGLEHWG